MKNKLLTLLTSVIALGLALSSCRSDLEPYPEDESVTARLVLDLGINQGPDNGSRAYDDEFEGPANRYEKVERLRVIIVREPNKAGAESHNLVEVNRVITGTPPEGEPLFFLPPVATQLADLGKYKFDVIDNEEKRIYLIANENSLPAELQKKLSEQQVGKPMFDIAAETVSIIPQEGTVGGYYIDLSNQQPDQNSPELFVPMSEFFDVSIDAKTKGKLVVGGTNGFVYEQEASLFITRLTTKFSFSASATVDTGSTFSIKSITVNNLGTTEYLLPNDADYNPVKNENSSRPLNGREITHFQVPAGFSTSSYTFRPETFQFVGPTTISTTAADWATYTPLVYFLESNRTAYNITVTTDVDGKEYTWTKNLPNLTLLPRNTHVYVHFVFKNNELSAIVKLVPWIGVSIDYTFGFDELIPWNRNPQPNT